MPVSMSKRPSFKKWAAAFELQYTTQSGPTGKRLSVREMLANLGRIELARGNVGLLRSNLLRACYLARYAADPKWDRDATIRRRAKNDLALVRGSRDEVESVLTLLAASESVARKAMTCGVSSGGKQPTRIAEEAPSQVAVLRVLLSRLSMGLKELEDPDHTLHISSSDFRYGPFETEISVAEWKHKPANVHETGLIFHLTFVFRFFTCPHVPVGSKIANEIVQPNVAMLKCGSPNAPIVASLVSATFRRKLSSENVRDRLRDLGLGMNRARAGKSELSKRKRSIVKFVGWD